MTENEQLRRDLRDYERAVDMRDDIIRLQDEQIKLLKHALEFVLAPGGHLNATLAGKFNREYARGVLEQVERMKQDFLREQGP